MVRRDRARRLSPRLWAGEREHQCAEALNDEKQPADTIGAAVMIGKIATGEIRDHHSADYVGGAPLAFRASG